MRLDKQMIAEYNRGAVLEIIAEKGPIHRSEVAKQLKLSIPTVMKIVDDFKQKGILEVTGKGDSAGGKRPELYEVVSNSLFCIGVDVGRNKINILLVNLMGEIIDKRVSKASDLSLPAEFIKVIIESIKTLLSKNRVDMDKLIGIGVGIPGIIDKRTKKILYSPDFNWENIEIISSIENEFGKRVVIENSNRTMVLGEKWIGAAKHAKNIFGVNIGHGIGAAILENNDIYTGSSGSSGEFGHTVLIKDGPLCECGNRGCLEAISSGRAIAQKMGMKEAKEVFDLARQGDQKAVQIIKEAVVYIGIGIASAINVLDPDMCILSGGVMKSYDFIEKDLLASISAHQMKHVGKRVKICVGKLGENASAIGAADLLIKRFLAGGGHIN